MGASICPVKIRKVEMFSFLSVSYPEGYGIKIGRLLSFPVPPP